MSDSDRQELEGRALSQALLGDRVSVLSIDGDWAQVAVPGQTTPLDQRGYVGWIPVRQLSYTAPEPSGTLMTIIAKTHLVDADKNHVLEVGVGTTLPIYTYDNIISTVGLPGGGTLFVEVVGALIYCHGFPSLALPVTWPNVVSLYVDYPYLPGGISAFGFDAAGFVFTIYNIVGVSMPRDEAAQKETGTAVSFEDLQPGDLVYFTGSDTTENVGVYIGNGSVVHASRANQAVKMATLEPNSFSGARRVLTFASATQPVPPGTLCVMPSPPPAP